MSETIWQRIEGARGRWDVLRHPFYRRWSAGELSAGELARYSGQYRHAVEAIATLTEAAAADAADTRDAEELRRHAAEERGHVRLWDGFVEASGGDAGDAPTPETEACVRAWTADGDLPSRLVRLYAIESGQPEISRTKLEGLLGPYGFDEGPATAYFSVHRGRDVEHAAEVREMVEALLPERSSDRLVADAESAFRANWRLLDGV